MKAPVWWLNLMPVAAVMSVNTIGDFAAAIGGGDMYASWLMISCFGGGAFVKTTSHTATPATIVKAATPLPISMRFFIWPLHHPFSWITIFWLIRLSSGCSRRYLCVTFAAFSSILYLLNPFSASLDACRYTSFFFTSFSLAAIALYA